MTVPRILHRRIRGGIYEGLISAEGAAPEIELRLEGRAIATPELLPREDRPGAWAMRAALPGEVLSDGVHALVLVERAGGTVIDSFTISTDAPGDDDLRAEIALLRAELDMLKSAFRRHCAETTQD